jgi:hypothetical protein
MSTQSQIAVGQFSPWSTWGKYNNIAFVIQQILSKIQTATLVEVLACSNDGGLSPVGTVDVKPCVNQIDSAGNPYPHTTIFNVPYLRLFGGKNGNAIILDPQPGDIGVAVFASRDISSVKATQAAANPGSGRQYDFSDALYLGGMLNGGTPTQYIKFDPSGIVIVSPNEISEKAPSIQLGNGGTLNPLMSKNFFDYWNTNILPFLQGLGYTGPIPPIDSVTSVLEAE